ncbi:MAG TPA: outer membrane protein assembly factor BamA [Thermoanaerobaculia bacterium]|nr:outer membrane protein assembly factor BamA [Thermoanaerobaculia bacterium]
MRFSSALAGGLVAGLLSLAVAEAQNPSPPPGPVPTPAAGLVSSPGNLTGEKIVGIRVVGYQTVSPDTVAHYLGIKVGDPYDPEAIRARFRTLWDVGLLDNVTIEAEHEAQGVTLVVTVEERPTITIVEFVGNKKVTTSQIKDRLKEQKIEIRPGSPLSLREIARVRSVIADYYLEQGFRSVSVEFHVEDVSKTEKKVVFTIDEGDKIKIASIQFTGNTVFPAWRLRNEMSKTKVATFWRVFSDNTTYSQANYEADVESIKGLYHSKGYKDVVVKDATLDIYITNPKAKPEKIKRAVRITIPLVEGDQYFVNEIRIVRVDQSGQPMEPPTPTVFPPKLLLSKFWELAPGTVLNRDYLVEALSSVETMYKSNGYIYWFADPVYKEVGNRRVDVEVKLFEGEKFYLGRFEVKGNTITRDKVIRREFALDEGAVMDMEAVKKSLQKLQQLGYFKIAEEPEFTVDPEQKKVNLTLKGTETSRNEIQFGAGYSAVDKFFGQFSFQTRNFMGRGEILSASAQLGKYSSFYDVSYTVPWFMDKNQSVGFSIYRRSENYQNIDQSRRGASVFYGKGIGIFDSWNLLYQYEGIQANFPVTGAPVPPGQPIPPTKFTAVTGRTSSFTPAFRYDSLNDPFDPTAGRRLFASVQLAGGVLGGSDYFIKPLVGGTIYFNVRIPRHAYIAVNLDVGWVAEYQGQPIPIFERFQLGGEQSLRGYRVGSILPLQSNNQVFTDSLGRILGGNKFFVLNLEYTFLQIGPGKLLVFGDLGNTYYDTQSFNPSVFRYSVGAEARIFLPIFQAPLRFIYFFNPVIVQPLDQFGFPISSLTEKKSGFLFSIGRTF